MKRCEWARSEISIRYHDQEWGVPLHDDRALFEFLILEGAQAGLNWETILKKRDNYRSAFSGFDALAVSNYGDTKIRELLADRDIVRNRLKIEAAVRNSRAFIAVQEKFGSFDAYLWRFVGGGTIQNCWKTIDEVPSTSPESIALSSDLKKRGFRFVGPTICYAFMQAVGMVNDHTVDCFRYKELFKPFA